MLSIWKAIIGCVAAFATWAAITRITQSLHASVCDDLAAVTNNLSLVLQLGHATSDSFRQFIKQCNSTDPTMHSLPDVDDDAVPLPSTVPTPSVTKSQECSFAVEAADQIFGVYISRLAKLKFDTSTLKKHYERVCMINGDGKMVRSTWEDRRKLGHTVKTLKPKVLHGCQIVKAMSVVLDQMKHACGDACSRDEAKEL